MDAETKDILKRLANEFGEQDIDDVFELINLGIDAASEGAPLILKCDSRQTLLLLGVANEGMKLLVDHIANDAGGD